MALIDKNIMAGQVICPSAPPLRPSTPDSLQNRQRIVVNTAHAQFHQDREKVMRQLPLEFGALM